MRVNEYPHSVRVLIAFLKYLEVNVTTTSVRVALLEHPDFPSLLALKDALSSWEIPKNAFKLKKDNFKIQELNVPCIVQYFMGTWYLTASSSQSDTSGRVAGVLSKSERNRPSSSGTVVNINPGPSIQGVLDKVERAGGTIFSQRMQIPAGYIALIIDSEGNKVGLHAKQ